MTLFSEPGHDFIFRNINPCMTLFSEISTINPGFRFCVCVMCMCVLGMECVCVCVCVWPGRGEEDLDNSRLMYTGYHSDGRGGRVEGGHDFA